MHEQVTTGPTLAPKKNNSQNAIVTLTELFLRKKIKMREEEENPESSSHGLEIYARF